MTFDEILEQAIELLQRRGRVSYDALKRQFGLDDEYLADLKSELIEVLAVAVEQDGKMLVWAGVAAPVQSSEFKVESSPQPQPVVSSQLSVHLSLLLPRLRTPNSELPHPRPANAAN